MSSTDQNAPTVADQYKSENKRKHESPEEKVTLVPPTIKRARIVSDTQDEPTNSQETAEASNDSNDRPPQNTPAQTSGTEETPSKSIDVCQSIDLQPESRLQVHWDISSDGILPTETRWWGATLCPHDGKMYTLTDVDDDQDTATVPLRVLNYDPYPEGGYPDRCNANVAFLSEHLLYDLETGNTVTFRKEGSTWEVPEENDEGIVLGSSVEESSESLRTLIETVLQAALVSSGIAEKMKTLSAAKQCVLGDKICRAKETFLTKMIQQVGGENGSVLTADTVKRCMAEMGEELRGM